MDDTDYQVLQHSQSDTIGCPSIEPIGRKPIKCDLNFIHIVKSVKSFIGNMYKNSDTLNDRLLNKYINTCAERLTSYILVDMVRNDEYFVGD